MEMFKANMFKVSAIGNSLRSSIVIPKKINIKLSGKTEKKP